MLRGRFVRGMVVPFWWFVRVRGVVRMEGVGGGGGVCGGRC